MRICFLTITVIIGSFVMGQDTNPTYLNTDYSFEERAKDLVGRMTLEEKVSQMIHMAKPIERLGIPYYNWMNECLHGVANMEDFVTVFPQSIGMGASWDKDCLNRVATAISDEARAMYHNGYLNREGRYLGGLTFWSPNINMFRDPRWGRGQESYGEDPFHIGKMGVQFIKGLQGENPKYLKVVSTAKHYVVHSGPEPERHEFDAVTSERDFWESYMPHFIDAVKEGNVYSVMCAYNRYMGESCCGSNYLLNEILRDRFNFNGYVVSDCGSVTDIFQYHKLNETPEEAAALAVKSGVDLNCGRGTYFPYESLLKAVEQDLISEVEIDQAVYRLMLARMKLGMFDPPELVPYSKIPKEVIDSKEHKDLALEMARKSIVLLKNENKILPLNKSVNKIALIGPNAANEHVILGNYNGTPSNPTSLFTGLKNKLPGTEIIYSKGCDYVKEPGFLNYFPTSILYTDKKLLNKGVKVEYFGNKNFEGKPVVEAVQQNISLSSEFGVPYKELEESNFSVRWTGFLDIPETAKYKIIAYSSENCKIFLDGELIIGVGESRSSEFILFEAGKSIELKIELVAETEEFDLVMLWKIDAEDIEKNALAAAKEADVVVMAMGISTEIEGEELGVELEGFSGGDRTTIELPKVQHELIKKIKELDKPIILVLLGGGSFALTDEEPLCDAILEAWYPGQAGGTALADILMGDYNPAGRLPLTFYKSTNDLPDFRNYSMEGRTYKFFKGEPLYAFGHGLSYTTFEYSNLIIEESIASGENIKVSVDLENTGQMAGDEVVQLYVKDVEASVRVPIQSLQAFDRIHLKAGEKQQIIFELKPKNLALLNNDMKWMVEPGEFIISMGGGQPGHRNNAAGVLTKSVNVTGSNYFLD